MKKLLKVLLCIVLVVLVAFGALLGWLTATEFKPEAVEPLEQITLMVGAPQVPTGQELKVLSWNIGYAGLGAGSDFFMDGGKNARSADAATVRQYLAGIDALTRDGGADLILLQEVDTNSSRTYSINEANSLAFGNSVHALNYSCPFVPIPIPPMGKVNSGLLTITNYEMDGSERIALPCPFSWPLSIANLKRCLLVSYLPVEGTDKQLVLVNLHLEAYDDGEGKIAQTNQLREFIQSEYEKGNYVIAGGDFNQVFPGSLEVYPNTHAENWEPGVLDENLLPEGWTLAYDLSAPSCRLLNQPYDPSDTVNTQYYVIDGLILSPNVTMNEVSCVDLAFADSDHNPVSVSVTLQ